MRHPFEEVERQVLAAEVAGRDVDLLAGILTGGLLAAGALGEGPTGTA